MLNLVEEEARSRLVLVGLSLEGSAASSHQTAATRGPVAVMIFFTDQVEAVFGPVSGTNPLFILAVYAPGIAAVLLVSWH